MARKVERIPTNACNWNNSIAMAEYMKCPNGHGRVTTTGGIHNGRKYLQASCGVEGCHVMQRVYADQLPEAV